MQRFALILSLIAVFSFGISSLAIASDAASGQLRPSTSSSILQEEEEKKSEPTEAKSEEPAEAKQADAEKKSEEASDESAEKKPDSTEKKEATKESASEKTDAKAEAKPEAAKRKTHKVEPKRLKVEVPLEGVFVARKMTEVPLRPEAWTSFEIEEVVEHGEKVREGETLFKFDDEKLAEAIADLELEQRLNELTIRRSEEELPRMEKQLKMDFDLAERSNREAKEDFDRYNEIDRPQTIKSAEFMVKYYGFQLDYEKDELDQLEKMYAADDLTEETEEVVLKRQRNALEYAEYSLENAVLRRDETLKIMLPRYDVAIKESLERAEMALARARTALSVDLNRARYELEQRKEARTKSLDRHAKLLEDRGLMEIKSPADGIVYYGQCVNGRWGETPQLINKYKPHGTVSSGSILMTIVESRPLYITATVDEGKRPDVAEGQKATIALPAEGADRLAADVKSISAIPVSSGKFEIELELPQDKIPDWVVAGMSCKIQVKSYDNKEALTVPKAAVRDDEDDPNQKYVWIVNPDDAEAKPERRNVTLGKRSGDDVEVIKGLKKDEVVSLDDESKKKAAE
jgi:multidrug efflux pump subunit AcrA (membrane-fusion protein)